MQQLDRRIEDLNGQQQRLAADTTVAREATAAARAAAATARARKAEMEAACAALRAEKEQLVARLQVRLRHNNAFSKHMHGQARGTDHAAQAVTVSGFSWPPV